MSRNLCEILREISIRPVGEISRGTAEEIPRKTRTSEQKIGNNPGMKYEGNSSRISTN